MTDLKVVALCHAHPFDGIPVLGEFVFEIAEVDYNVRWTGGHHMLWVQPRLEPRPNSLPMCPVVLSVGAQVHANSVIPVESIGLEVAIK